MGLGEGAAYNLILNKFPVLPQHLLLTTATPTPQTDPLTAADLSSLWSVLLPLVRLTL